MNYIINLNLSQLAVMTVSSQLLVQLCVWPTSSMFCVWPIPSTLLKLCSTPISLALLCCSLAVTNPCSGLLFRGNIGWDQL